jgi:hypothetical protein
VWMADGNWHESRLLKLENHTMIQMLGFAGSTQSMLANILI